MKIQIVLFAVFAAFLGFSDADNSGCPHPSESKHLILEQIIVAARPDDGRNVVDIEVPREVLGRSDLSCISVVARTAGSTPDFISFGRNQIGGYSIIVHSRLRNPLNATLFIYTQ